MDPFLSLPDELIVKMCNEMGTESLLSLSESSSRVYQVCYNIVKERKIADFEDSIKHDQGFKKNFGKSTVIIGFDTDISRDKRNIRQMVIGGEIKDVPWILPEILPGILPYTPLMGTQQHGSISLSNGELRKQLAKNLVDQGYEKISY